MISCSPCMHSVTYDLTTMMGLAYLYFPIPVPHIHPFVCQLLRLVFSTGVELNISSVILCLVCPEFVAVLFEWSWMQDKDWSA
jgi:hypothetical protein